MQFNVSNTECLHRNIGRVKVLLLAQLQISKVKILGIFTSPRLTGIRFSESMLIIIEIICLYLN